jgi:hypothetical protein
MIYKGLPENARAKYDKLVQESADVSTMVIADIARLQDLLRGEKGDSPEALTLEARVKMRRDLQTNLKQVIDRCNTELRKLPVGTKLFDVDPVTVEAGDDDLDKIGALRDRISQGRDQFRMISMLPPTSAEMRETITQLR